MSELKSLKSKIEAELKSKTPSAERIFAEFEKVYNSQRQELERMQVRCKALDKRIDSQRFENRKSEFQRPQNPTHYKR